MYRNLPIKRPWALEILGQKRGWAFTRGWALTRENRGYMYLTIYMYLWIALLLEVGDDGLANQLGCPDHVQHLRGQS